MAKSEQARQESGTGMRADQPTVRKDIQRWTSQHNACRLHASLGYMAPLGSLQTNLGKYGRNFYISLTNRFAPAIIHPHLRAGTIPASTQFQKYRPRVDLGERFGLQGDVSPHRWLIQHMVLIALCAMMGFTTSATAYESTPEAIFPSSEPVSTPEPDSTQSTIEPDDLFDGSSDAVVPEISLDVSRSPSCQKDSATEQSAFICRAAVELIPATISLSNIEILWKISTDLPDGFEIATLPDSHMFLSEDPLSVNSHLIRQMSGAAEPMTAMQIAIIPSSSSTGCTTVAIESSVTFSVRVTSLLTGEEIAEADLGPAALVLESDPAKSAWVSFSSPLQFTAITSNLENDQQLATGTVELVANLPSDPCWVLVLSVFAETDLPLDSIEYFSITRINGVKYDGSACSLMTGCVLDPGTASTIHIEMQIGLASYPPEGGFGVRLYAQIHAVQAEL